MNERNYAGGVLAFFVSALLSYGTSASVSTDGWGFVPANVWPAVVAGITAFAAAVGIKTTKTT